MKRISELEAQLATRDEIGTANGPLQEALKKIAELEEEVESLKMVQISVVKTFVLAICCEPNLESKNQCIEGGGAYKVNSFTFDDKMMIIPSVQNFNVPSLLTELVI
ncbi:hypothetical protein C5167_000088 [Papaver somniferum]|uniref:Uncharacterized protein n=1 Tax=Papaver somniferum TaxID=3469 RepID=A0A4Y7KSW1_PAPSO|nr:hypothetical protein C5167_000088 [Papaver somniferum]